MKPAYVVIDTETTGLGHLDKPPRPDGIVQVAIAWRDENRTNPARAALLPVPSAVNVSAWGVSSRSWNVNPGTEYLDFDRAAKAFYVNGRTLPQVLASPPARIVAEELRAFLRSLGSPEIRSYNVAFDEPFLAGEPWSLGRSRATWGPCIMRAATPPCDKCQGSGIVQHQTGLGERQRIACPWCYGSGRGRWPKLQDAAKRFGIDVDELKLQAHTAEGDAILALHVQEALDAKTTLPRTVAE
jgi:DNA polymerase III epsilon subunit-like protein